MSRRRRAASLPAPDRSIDHNEKYIRRLDAIVKLITPTLTACTAITITRTGITVTMNQTSVRKAGDLGSTPDAIDTAIKRDIQARLSILQQHFARYGELTTSSEHSALLQATIDGLIGKGGLSRIIPGSSNPSTQKRAALRILHKLSIEVASKGTADGLNENECSALSTKRITDAARIVRPKDYNNAVSRLTRVSTVPYRTHAEQLMTLYLKNVKGVSTGIGRDTLPIGISKLPCKVCHSVLAANSVATETRGTHGATFPYTYDTSTHKNGDEDKSTDYHKAVMVADASDSDPDDDDWLEPPSADTGLAARRVATEPARAAARATATSSFGMWQQSGRGAGGHAGADATTTKFTDEEFPTLAKAFAETAYKKKIAAR